MTTFGRCNEEKKGLTHASQMPPLSVERTEKFREWSPCIK